MKLISFSRWYVLTAIVFVGLSSGSIAGAPPELLVVSVSAPAVTKVGSEIRLKISLANVSNQRISVLQARGTGIHGEANNEIVVRDENGKLLPSLLDDLAKKSNEYGISIEVIDAHPIFIEPGTPLQEEVILSQLFDLSRPGTYSVTVTRPLPERLGSHILHSNVVMLTVAE